MCEINTWADGFGRWYAQVPVDPETGRPANGGDVMARRAIRAELEARGELGKAYRVRVEQLPPSEPDALGGPWCTIYREAS